MTHLVLFDGTSHFVDNHANGCEVIRLFKSFDEACDFCDLKNEDC